MKKIFLAIIIIISSNLKSQNTNLLNLPKYDKQWYHFGFTLGLMNTNLKIDYQQNLSLKNISAISSPGFNVGIICDLKILKNLNLRFIPSLTFTQRDINFTSFENIEIIKSTESSNLDLPILLKYRSLRYKNMRPYFLLGSRFTYDMASKKEVEDINLFKLDEIDYGVEFGFGIDIYLPYFKLAPEIKYFYGFNDLLQINNVELITSNIESLYSRTILFSLTFE
tara:strand:- start:138 stop:809 length:672 start_codon:yes stop_codon:yes gene_type:complete